MSKWLLFLSLALQSSEPRFLANVRRYFADFPYLHLSIDQRLLTLETWCGYWYGQVFVSFFQTSALTHQLFLSCFLWFSWAFHVSPRTLSDLKCSSRLEALSQLDANSWAPSKKSVIRKRDLFPESWKTSQRLASFCVTTSFSALILQLVH